MLLLKHPVDSLFTNTHNNTYKYKQQANKIGAMVGSIEEHALSSQMLPNTIS